MRRGIRRDARWRIVLALALQAAIAGASGPRFVTGPPFFTGQAGLPIGWKQPTLLYYTDPGNLGTAVNHQASDALVAAAAGVWNLPVASITLGQGGALGEHVSGQNVYMDTTGLVFPADVMSANAAAIPIAVIYDTDGSVTDLLLGSGASDPSGCRQNGVTESVDSFDPAGYILHAMVVVNGRCSGTDPEMQLELQYQLMRAFGRVLGLAWSQTNDNVFTGTPTPTYGQAMNWPVMHPIDIVCGTYVYQCMPSPFQLRADDIASMVAVYPIGQNATPAAGKQPSLSAAGSVNGHVYFPTGEGMAGVNVLVRREPNADGGFEPWFDASGVTGANFRQAGTSPFVAADGSAWGSFGTVDQNQIGGYFIGYLPLLAGVPWQNISISTEPVNALYMGEHTLGPYALGDVTPSGSAPVALVSYVNGPFAWAQGDFTVADAAPVCGNGEDGTAQSPMAVPGTGWWNGLLCGYGHASYVTAAVRPGRSFTIEVTALDETGVATEGKAMPVIGLFAPTDAAGSLPSLGVTPSAFQGRAAGTTTIGADTGQLTSLRFGIADERGDGRPDYNYQARLFYADSVTPAEVPSAGQQVTISGMGFRAGNAVTINGVQATVVSWSANAIVVTAPSMAAAKATSGTAVDVVVSDLSTGASSTMTGAFTYVTAAALPNSMKIVSAPAGTVYVGDAAAVAFAVEVVGPDGVTPVAGNAVTFSAAPGSAQFAACAAASCTVTTGANGMASTVVTPEAAGTVTIQALDGALTQSATFQAEAQTGTLVIYQAPSGNQPVGVAAPQQLVVQDSAPITGVRLAGRSILLTVPAGSATYGGCASAVCTVITDSNGTVQVSVTPTATGPVTLQAADGDVKQTTSFTAVSNTDVMQTVVAPTATTYLGDNSGQFAIVLLRADGVTPDWLEPVTFTAPAGVVLAPCGTNVCTVPTNWSGQVAVSVYAPQLGVFSLQAGFGSVTATATIAVVNHTQELKVVSAPSGNLAVGMAAAAPFTVQLLEDGTVPLSGGHVTLSGPPGSVTLGVCGTNPSCWEITDGNGMVSTSVIPLTPGQMSVNAVIGQVVQTISFTAVGVGETMLVTQQPGSAGVWVGDQVNVAVQLIGPGGGLISMAGDDTLFSVVSGSFSFTSCGLQVCTQQPDPNGNIFEFGVATVPGPIVLLVSDGKVSQRISFIATARPDVMKLISSPASGGTAGTVAPVPFSVQVLASDGVTVVPGKGITVSVTSGSASLIGCGAAASCVLTTDSNGILTTAVTPLAAGTITLTATDGSVQQTVSFSAIGQIAPDTISLVATPGASLYAGATASSPLSVRVTLADGVTPVAGIAIGFAASSQSAGTVLFGACGAAACTVATGTNGVASSAMTGGSAGAVTLVATANLPTGAASVSYAMDVVANQLSVTALNPQTYVAEGATMHLALTADAVANGNPAVGQAMVWAGGPGFVAATANTVTDGNGASSIAAALGPLAAGAKASLTACAWTNVCAEFDGTGVAAANFTVSLVSGGQQSVTGGAAPAPVVALVADGAGHAVAAAAVGIYQTVTAYVDCPSVGRCPAAPVLASQATMAVSAVDGTVTVVPLTVPGTATQTAIALSAGTQGFATTAVTVRQ